MAHVDKRERGWDQSEIGPSPFAACPTLHTGTPVECKRCPAATPETAEHALLDCPAYAELRESARFAPLCENALPPQVRMRAFASQKFQRLLAEFCARLL